MFCFLEFITYYRVTTFDYNLYDNTVWKKYDTVYVYCYNENVCLNFENLVFVIKVYTVCQVHEHAFYPHLYNNCSDFNLNVYEVFIYYYNIIFSAIHVF